MKIIFGDERFSARELLPSDEELVQEFCAINPEYWQRISKKPPEKLMIRAELYNVGNRQVKQGRTMRIGIFDTQRNMMGVSYVVSDFLARGVWHIELFVVATALHGTGASSAIYKQLESWIISLGGQWIRLGSAVGQDQALRFWGKMGYRPLGKWDGRIAAVDVTLQLMLKPLTTIPVIKYFKRVPNDLHGYELGLEQVSRM